MTGENAKSVVKDFVLLDNDRVGVSADGKNVTVSAQDGFEVQIEPVL